MTLFRLAEDMLLPALNVHGVMLLNCIGGKAHIVNTFISTHLVYYI